MSTKLNENQQCAINLLACGKTAAFIADELDVRKETISRWRQLPEFQAELNTLIEEVRESSRNKLAHMLDKALLVIEEDLQNMENSNLRNRTAFKILQLAGGGSLSLPTQPLPTTPELVKELEESKSLINQISTL